MTPRPDINNSDRIDNGDERRRLTDTLTRISLRYGRAVHALSLVPGPLALAYLYRDPDAADVQDAAEAITAAINTAIAELGWIEYYAYPLTDPAARPVPNWRGHDDLTSDPTGRSTRTATQ
jgi:hypothetical protein